jgi:hypothetical protein
MRAEWLAWVGVGSFLDASKIVHLHSFWHAL